MLQNSHVVKRAGARGLCPVVDETGIERLASCCLCQIADSAHQGACHHSFRVEAAQNTASALYCRINVLTARRMHLVDCLLDFNKRVLCELIWATPCTRTRSSHTFYPAHAPPPACKTSVIVRSSSEGMPTDFTAKVVPSERRARQLGRTRRDLGSDLSLQR